MKKPVHRQPNSGTWVAELGESWRLHRGGIRTFIKALPVSELGKIHYIPSFEVGWRIQWVRIRNGEKVIHELFEPAVN